MSGHALEWRENVAGKSAWFNGDRQVTGAYLDHVMQGYALEVHGLVPREEAPTAEFKDHPEFARLAARYGHLTLSEMDALAESMKDSARAALSQHAREFDGKGGRRYGPAMATQAGDLLAVASCPSRMPLLRRPRPA